MRHAALSLAAGHCVFPLFEGESEEGRITHHSRQVTLVTLLQHRRRMSIDNSKEDDLLMSQDIEIDMIHLQSQPSCIQGTMRDYQIAALNWLLN